MKAGGDRFTMGRINLVASRTLQHGAWAASQYLNKVDIYTKLESHDALYHVIYIINIFERWVCTNSKDHQMLIIVHCFTISKWL